MGGNANGNAAPVAGKKEEEIKEEIKEEEKSESEFEELIERDDSTELFDPSSKAEGEIDVSTGTFGHGKNLEEQFAAAHQKAHLKKPRAVQSALTR